MAGFGQDPAGSLEDQLRRMILQGSGPYENSLATPTGASSNPAHDARNVPSSGRWPSNQPSRHQQSGSVPDLSLGPSAPIDYLSGVTESYNNLAPPPGLTHPQRFNQSATARYSKGAQRSGTNRQSLPQQMPLDPAVFQRLPPFPTDGNVNGHNQKSKQLFTPHNTPSRVSFAPRHVALEKQAQYLDRVATTEVAKLQMSQSEQDEKEAFRVVLQSVCHEIFVANPKRIPAITLKCFGSFQSGFASAGSDMDLVIVVNDQSQASACFSLLANDLPRTLEKQLLALGYGARLLSRTRVPIIKFCEKPGKELLERLREERDKWDALSDEKKYPHLYPSENTGEEENSPEQHVVLAQRSELLETPSVVTSAKNDNLPMNTGEAVQNRLLVGAEQDAADAPRAQDSHKSLNLEDPQNSHAQKAKRDAPQSWTRERKAGPLDFPKSGVGIQSDINFFNPLGLHNTQMLRCYSLCDPRVRPMALFIKAWAKRRKINSSYSGTLSSYGYVLMLLHYLVNVARPPVLPNLQLPWRPNNNCTPHQASQATVDDWDVTFWSNEDEIRAAVEDGQMTSNSASIGSLLAGFFQYFSSMGSGPQFRWTASVLSLRSQTGVLTKVEKGWVKATTEEGEGRRIQHRYLFCIEDPFELSHNVARTVTHNGIVAIRDEFRRAFRILQSIGNGTPSLEGDVFDQLEESSILASNPKSTPGHDAATLRRTRTPHHPRSEQSSVGGNGPSHEPKVSGSAAKAAHKKQDSPNLADNVSFPTLGSIKEKKKTTTKVGYGAGEISGGRAQAYLAEVRRKQADLEARKPALGPS